MCWFSIQIIYSPQNNSEKKIHQSLLKHILYISTVRKARLIKKGFVFKRKHKINNCFMCGCIKKDVKFRCKGVQKIRIQNPLQKMLRVLRTG